jgi:uncharacterized protein YjbJ (UPF0337 family)
VGQELDEHYLEMRWNDLRQDVRRHWVKLTDQDLDEIAGDREKLAERVQERYGCARKVADEGVDRFIDQHNQMYRDDVIQPFLGG